MSSKVMAVLAILVTLCCAALVALQLWEMYFYRQPPSVWPAVMP